MEEKYPTNKNLLFITADQLRADCLFGKYAKFVKTPNLDRLMRMRRSTTFERHYTTVCPCGPARASLHTGTYLFNHGVYDNGVPLAQDLANWAAELVDNNIAKPALIGYVDLVPDLRREKMKEIHWDGGFLPGIERITDTDNIATKPWLREKLGLHESHPLLNQGLQWNGYRGSMEWIKRRRKGQPPQQVHVSYAIVLHILSLSYCM